jgi:hypothetical protein
LSSSGVGRDAADEGGADETENVRMAKVVDLCRLD